MSPDKQSHNWPTNKSILNKKFPTKHIAIENFVFPQIWDVCECKYFNLMDFLEN